MVSDLLPCWLDRPLSYLCTISERFSQNEPALYCISRDHSYRPDMLPEWAVILGMSIESLKIRMTCSRCKPNENAIISMWSDSRSTLSQRNELQRHLTHIVQLCENESQVSASMSLIYPLLTTLCCCLVVQPIETILSAAVGGFVVVSAAVLRVYLGYAYVGNRLLTASLDYEETGWYAACLPHLGA